MKISAAIITFNEEENIEACIQSLLNVADEIIVVDSFSTDKTEEICKGFKEVKFLKHKFEGHVEQKNYAMRETSNTYVLSLDADELLSSKLQREIIGLKKLPNEFFDAYSMPRLNNYCGKWIRHSGWYPDRKIRLWDKDKGKWGGKNPHDRVIMKEGSTTKSLKSDLLHYTTSSISTHIDQINRFSEIAAKQLLKSGKNNGDFLKLIFNPPFTFFKKYIIQLGFLDGFYGFVIAVNSAHSKFLKYAKFYQFRKKL